MGKFWIIFFWIKLLDNLFYVTYLCGYSTLNSDNSFWIKLTPSNFLTSLNHFLQEEMTKIVQAIYDMLGAGATKPTDSAEERAKNIFSRMDENGDGHLTEEEFLRGCLQDDELSKMLAPNVVQ